MQSCGFRPEAFKDLRSAKSNVANLRNNGDARHRMNFIPLTVKRILHISPDNADVRAHGLLCR
jgi:hypothetical protein